MNRILGRAVLGIATILAMAALSEAAFAYRVLYTFQGGSDGEGPNGLLHEGGIFYGTTGSGGNGTCTKIGCGTIFKWSPNGTETVLYSFHGTDGYAPSGTLITDKSGNLYGTTYFGGAHFYGNVFKFAPDGTETVLYSFAWGNDGLGPEGGVVMDKAGNLYGTTYFGGGTGCYGNGCGIVYKIAPNGAETILYAFKGSNDGTNPAASLILDHEGNLFGTTANYAGTCCGSVFKLAPDGTETILYAFKGVNDGATPKGSLIRDDKGNLFGTTIWGGASQSCSGGCRGTVFKLAPDGAETILYTFACQDADRVCNNGAYPSGGLVEDAEGNLYGTALLGGSNGICDSGVTGCGTVFKIAPNGPEKTLYQFCAQNNCADGGAPSPNLFLDNKGRLFGTAGAGGLNGCGLGSGCGTVFKIKK